MHDVIRKRIFVAMTLPDTGTALETWTAALARPTIAPAGGSAAAIAAAMGASLVAMVAGLTMERTQDAGRRSEAQRIQTEAERRRHRLLQLAADDAKALAELADALALPARTDAERETRGAAKRQALADAGRVQADVTLGAADVAEMGERIAAIGPRSALGDAATATLLAAAAARSACWAAQSDLGNDAAPLRDALARAEAAERKTVALLGQR